MSASATKQLEVAERRRNALELRSAGMTLEMIADRVPGYPAGRAGVAAVSKDIHRALTARLTEVGRSIETLREMQGVRLDRLQAALWSTAVTRPPPPPAPAAGDSDSWDRYEAALATYERVLDRQLTAADKALKVIAERSKLYALYAPQTHHILTMDAVEAEIARLTSELAHNDPSPEPAAPE